MFNSIKIAVFGFFLCGVSLYSIGQSVIQIEKRAREALKNKQYEAAKIDYQILVSREPSSADYNFHYALCIFHTESKKASQKYFEVSIKNSSAFCDAHYYLGRIFHASYLFNDAITAFETYRACDPSDSKNAAKEINYCQQGSMLLENPRSLSTLSVFSSPITTYTQKYPLDDIGGGIFTNNDLQTKLDKKNNYVPLSYFKRGDSYKFYASYGEAGEFLKLFFIKRISQDVWSKPQQIILGSTQAYDAVSPFYDAENNMLYFAANGLNSMGGFDLFKVPFVDESVTGEILNLDFPFSSSADDFYYIPLNSKGTKACFASDRNSPLGKIQVFTIQNQLQQNETLVLQGQFLDLVDAKNTRVQVTVKDSEDGMVYGPFTSNEQGQYQITLPGPGEYQFTASINGTTQVFNDTKRIPSQKSNITFKQTIKYSMDNVSEVAQFLYDFNGPISQELKAYKANVLSSLTLNPKTSVISSKDSINPEDTKIDQPVKNMETALVALGFTQSSLEEQSNALADRLLELSLKGTLIQDEIDALTESMETLSLTDRQLQEKIKALERDIDRTSGNSFQQAVYQKELKNTIDSLEKLTRKQLVVASLIKSKQADKNQWDLSNQEPSVTELSDAIKLSLMKENRDSLIQLLTQHEKKIAQFINEANPSNEPKNNSIGELTEKQQATANKLVALQNEQKLLIDKQASLTIQQENATKKELESIKNHQAELKKSNDIIASSIQTLQKENELTGIKIDLMKEVAALNGGDLPKEHVNFVDQSAQIEELLTLKSYAKELVSISDKNDLNAVFDKDLSVLRTEDQQQLKEAVQSEMLLIKNKLDKSTGQESQRLAERYQWLEAKSEELNAILVTNPSSSGETQTRTQETTTNPTTGATETTNGVAQTRSQETTTNPTTGTTETTNGVAQTRTQETTTNPTTGTTETTNGVAQTRTQESTTNPNPEMSLEKLAALEQIKEDVLTEAKMLDKLPLEYQESNPLKAIKNQLTITNELIQLSQILGEKGMAALFSPLELQSMAQDAKAVVKQINSTLPSGQQLEIKSIQAITEVFEADIQSNERTENNQVERIEPTDEMIAQYASKAGYDRYVSLIKEQVKITQELDALNGRITALKKELYVEIDDTKRTAIRNELLELVQQKLMKEKQFNELDRTLRGMPDITYYSALLEKQILPKSGTNETSFVSIDEQALAFQVGGETNVQQGKLPVLNQMPMGLIFRVQVGAFRYKVPGYFFREFSPVSGEKLTNNLTAYLVGYFVDSKAAKNARTLIRQTGYQDAFIVAYCDGKRIPFNLAIQYEQNGMCKKREQTDVLKEVVSYFKDSINQAGAVQGTPKEIFYTVQVASLKKEDNGKLNKVPELFYNLSVTGNYKYSSGKFSSLNDAKVRRNEMRATGYADAFIVAYRDGIPVSFQEAEVGLAYMKEAPKMNVTPVNTDLLGVKTEEPAHMLVQYKKRVGTMALSDFSNFNQLKSCVLAEDELLLAPLNQDEISPLFQILYADFDAVEIPEESINALCARGTMAEITIAHDFALRGTVPFQLTNSMSEGTGILFYPRTEIDKIRIMDQLKKLNLTIKD